MKNHLFKKLLITLPLVLVSILCLFWGVRSSFSGFTHLLPFGYNQDRNALAQTEKPVICKKQAGIKLPAGIEIKLGPNELEIPIGEATDKTENIARTISEELQKTIIAANAEVEAAKKMSGYADECRLSNCNTPGCHKTAEICIRPPCQGNACPHKAEIAEKLSVVEEATKKISNAYGVIAGIFTKKQNRPIGQWWCNCLSPIFQCDPTAGQCRTDIEIILDKLEKARSGDYQVYDLLEIERFKWNHQPPGLKDCVLRPEHLEAVLRGERKGVFLMSCKTALSSGLIDEESCYGQIKCEAEIGKGKEPPEKWLCPRMENYYCCE